MLSKFNYIRPYYLEEALIYLKKNNGTKILAGGTDLMVRLRHNLETPNHILDIKSIPEAQLLEYKPSEGLFIGAAVTVNQVAQSVFIQNKYSSLIQAANLLASYQLRNRATVVGNICNASPGADLAPALLIYEAKIHIAGYQCKRIVNIKDFFIGVKKTVLLPGELVIGISLPDVDIDDNSVYSKQSRIKGHDLTIVGVAIRFVSKKFFLIAMAAIAPTPIRLTKLEKFLSSQPLTHELANLACDEVRKQINPISDVRSCVQYRLHIAGILVKRGISKLLDM